MAESVNVVTSRPGNERQTFVFRATDGFLESTTNIPEPHEFVATLAMAHDGHELRYETQFTEAAHGHAHDQGSPGEHSHRAGAHKHDEHDHDHGSGLLGWFRGTFAHSHSVTEKVDETMESNERGIRALKISLIGLGLTALFQLMIVLASGSIALLADTIHNFADAGTSIPLWIAFVLAQRGRSRRFTYGYGKTEDVAGVLIVLIIFFSACVAAYEAVMKIIHPQPITYLWWVAAAAIIGFIGNEAVAVFRIKVGKEIGSAALVADGQHARVDGFTSLSVLLGVFGVLLGFPIIDPIVGIGISIAILFIVKDAAKAIWVRLIDGIEPEILSEIEHAPTHVPGVLGVNDVRARWVGHKVYTDVAINVDPQLSVRDADLIASKVEQALRDHVRLLGHAVVRVSPALTVATP
jgi:cation diffusion facilitator family transporter